MNVRNAKHNHEKNEASTINISLRKKYQIKSLLQHVNFVFKFDKLSFNVYQHVFCFINQNLNVTFQEILSQRRLENFDYFLIIKNIYNAKKKLRKKKLGAYTFIQTFL